MSEETLAERSGKQKLHQLRVQRLRQPRFYIDAIAVGGGAGLMSLAFEQSLARVESVRTRLLSVLHQSPYWGWFVPLLVDAVVGGALATLTHRLAPDAAGSGIPHIKGVLHHTRRFSWKRILPVKFVCGLAAIGGGFSLGREGPCVQMGAAVGRAISEWLKLEEDAASLSWRAGLARDLPPRFMRRWRVSSL